MNPAFLTMMIVAGVTYYYLTAVRGESGSGAECWDGEVRLMDKFDGGVGGRVEFCHKGEWGSVCDHDWGDKDARVVCRQLGLPTQDAHALPGFGGGNGSTLIDNAACTGEEERLEDCTHNGIGVNDCPLDHSHDAGVFCDPNGDEVCPVHDDSSNKYRTEDCSTAHVSRSCLQRYGNCVPYNAREMPTPCDDFYKSGVDYVYIPYQRIGGSFSKFMANVVKFGPQLLSSLESCYETARRVICHFYLPPCGNSTHFRPPTSVCSDTCKQLRDLCPTEWDSVVQTFEQNKIILEVDGLLFIDCEDTGQYLSPLPYCCSKAGVNASAILGRSTASNDSDRILRYGVAGVVSFLVVVGVAMCGGVILLVYLRRRHQTQDLLISSPIPLGRVIKGRETTIHRYIEHSISTEVPHGAVPCRVASSYVRQMAEDELLIPGSHIQMMGTIGQGEFGVVCRAFLCRWKGTTEELVAVKTLKGSLSHSELDALVEESLLMSRFDHRNVMKLIGVSIENNNTLYIVMPFMTHGSLLSYLRSHRAELTIDNDDDPDLVETTGKKLLSMCLQIAKGMEYLASQKFVHRDLAARNCMIDESFVIKVADFGLSEDIYARNYFRQGRTAEEGETPVKLPVKWMALESLNDGVFSEKTDVWSFGVTCWEVFSLGKSPYPGVDPFTLIKYLERGERLEKPANSACSPDMFSSVMVECWKEDPNLRPRFGALVTEISTILEEMAGYMDFNSLPLESSSSEINNSQENILVSSNVP